MKVPESRKVTKSLALADKSIKTSLRALNQNAAKLMARGNYSGAQALATVGSEIQTFRAELESLRKKWGQVGGTNRGTGGNNSATPLWAYYQPILQALVSLGGEARRPDIEPQVEQLMKHQFQPGDHDPMSHGRSRWQIMIRRAHRPMVKEGWLEKRVGKSWRITAAGRQAAKAEISSVKGEKEIS